MTNRLLRPYGVAMTVVIFAVAATKTGRPLGTTLAAEKLRDAGSARIIRHDQISAPFVPPVQNRQLEKARCELIQEVILSLDEVPLEDLFEAVVTLYPNLTDRVALATRSSTSVSLHSAEARFRLRVYLVEYLSAEVAQLGDEHCQR